MTCLEKTLTREKEIKMLILFSTFQSMLITFKKDFRIIDSDDKL